MLIEVSTARGVQQLRSEPRMKVLLTGDLRTPKGTIVCRLLDISRGGACLEADEPQEVGARVALNRGQLAVNGTVVWSRGRRCGVRFEGSIRATDLFVQMSASRRAQPAPVNVAAIPLSPSR